MEIIRPDQVWVGDITYIRIGDGTFVYLAILMNVFTRIIRGAPATNMMDTHRHLHMSGGQE
jgi:transposase InsO family protein